MHLKTSTMPRAKEALTGFLPPVRSTRFPLPAASPQTMCGVVAVANVVHESVRYVFNGNKMSLSFRAKVSAGGGGGSRGEGGESIERYRTELVLAGSVDAAKVRKRLASL